MRATIENTRRIVLKAGTSILRGGRGERGPFARIAAETAELLRGRRQVALVSSGAIAFGLRAFGLRSRPRRMARLQACAAVGQARLMRAWEEAFSPEGLLPAQILLTRDALESRPRFLAARRTFEELFRMGAVPVVNENDSVATEEIAFGDNDLLAVQVAHLLRADLVVLLSDVDGFRRLDGSRVAEVAGEEELSALSPHLRDLRREDTVGGMRAKLAAARLALSLQVPMLILDGRRPGALKAFLAGEDLGTVFSPKTRRSGAGARKQWIAYAAARKGAVIVDAGACSALRRDASSLLPRGLVRAEGPFSAGDVVELRGPDGRAVGRGIARYSSAELTRIAGRRSDEIAEILGRTRGAEVVHRDDMVIFP